MQPRLKVALLRNAAMLDDEHFKLICDLAEKYDFQVFAEVPDFGGTPTVVIAEGLVASGGNAPGTPLELEAPTKRKRKAKAESPYDPNVPPADALNHPAPFDDDTF